MVLQDTPAQAVPVLADFRVVRLIGEGNHGRFYLAHPPARLGIDDEYVAVKVFAGQCSEDAFRRGTRELRAFAAVDSPYLARVYDAVLEDNFLYAMEYFPLGSLAAPARPLARQEVLRAVEHAARAVHALHEAGLAHGDVKPGNVMLHEDGAPEAEVLDFIRHHAPASEARARQSLRFISQPSFRAYIFTYSVGGALVEGWMERHGAAGFARLLSEPLTPGQLRAETA